MLKLLKTIGTAMGNPINKLIALGFAMAITTIGLFYWQLHSLQSDYELLVATNATTLVKNTALVEDITSLQEDFDRKTQANLWWQKENKQLAAALGKQREAYNEAIKNETEETKACLETPLSDPVFNALTRRL